MTASRISTDTLSTRQDSAGTSVSGFVKTSRTPLSIYAQGECLPRHDNYVKLDLENKDAWGIPALHIHASYGENEHAMAKAIHPKLSEIIDALKLEDVQPPSEKIQRFRQKHS